MPLSVRLDADTETAIRRLARRRKQTKSAVVREAIAALEDDAAVRAPSGHNRWDAIAHLIGAADSRGARLSEDTGEKFRAIVREKSRARRSR